MLLSLSPGTMFLPDTVPPLQLRRNVTLRRQSLYFVHGVRVVSTCHSMEAPAQLGLWKTSSPVLIGRVARFELAVRHLLTKALIQLSLLRSAKY